MEKVVYSDFMLLINPTSNSIWHKDRTYSLQLSCPSSVLSSQEGFCSISSTHCLPFHYPCVILLVKPIYIWNYEELPANCSSGSCTFGSWGTHCLYACLLLCHLPVPGCNTGLSHCQKPPDLGCDICRSRAEYWDEFCPSAPSKTYPPFPSPNWWTWNPRQ